MQINVEGCVKKDIQHKTTNENHKTHETHTRSVNARVNEATGNWSTVGGSRKEDMKLASVREVDTEDTVRCR